MLIDYKRGQGSIVLRVFINDSTVATGAGKTGLTNASAGLNIATIANNEAAPTVYTVAASNVETITTPGTFVAPSASKCRFKEIDATNLPGVYEVQLADARYNVASAKALLVLIHGAAGAAPCPALIPLRDVDPYDPIRFGMTALPAVAAGAAGGLPIGLATGSVTVGAYAAGQGPLKPTVDGRTLDVTATGAAGIDWANIENQSTGVNLLNTQTGIVELVMDVLSLESGAIGTASFQAGAINAAALATDAISAAKVSADAVTKIQNGLGTAANQTTILDRLGAFTGTGINTVLGFLRALGRKDAALTPSDFGGTFDNTTDSQEASRDSVMLAGSYVAPDNAGIGTAAAQATQANTKATVIQAKTDLIPASPAAVGSAMTLTPAERTAVANEVELQFIDDSDAEKVINALVVAIGNTNVSEAGLVGLIRADVERGGGLLATLVARVTEVRMAELDPGNLPADVAAIKTEVDKVPRSGTTYKWTRSSGTVNSDTVAIGAP